jgi:hypothetical protein
VLDVRRVSHKRVRSEEVVIPRSSININVDRRADGGSNPSLSARTLTLTFNSAEQGQGDDEDDEDEEYQQVVQQRQQQQKSLKWRLKKLWERIKKVKRVFRRRAEREEEEEAEQRRINAQV